MTINLEVERLEAQLEATREDNRALTQNINEKLAEIEELQKRYGDVRHAYAVEAQERARLRSENEFLHKTFDTEVERLKQDRNQWKQTAEFWREQAAARTEPKP